jgi:hypothetical protein
LDRFWAERLPPSRKGTRWDQILQVLVAYLEVRPDGMRVDDDSGRGAIASTAITALAPAAEGFPAGRDFAAWLGLTPLQKSTGGKQKLGAVSKRGERTIRRLLIIGVSAVVRQASRRGAPNGVLIAWAALPGGDSGREEEEPQPLLDFRPVLANRDVLALMVGSLGRRRSILYRARSRQQWVNIDIYCGC